MIKPARGYVLILPDKAEDKTASGLYISEKGQEKPMKGVVKAMGDGENQPCNRADRVYYKRWGTEDIKEDGKEYVIVRFEDVLAIVS